MCLLIQVYSNSTKSILLTLYDFSSAFNCLCFSIFHKKIEACKIKNNAFNFFKSYAKPRDYVYMKIGKIESEKWREDLGIVQGCVGGPPAFKFYTNDIQLPNSVRSGPRSKYADDTGDLLYRDTWTEVEYDLKLAMDDMHEKSVSNLLTLNLSKSKTLPIFTGLNNESACGRGPEFDIRYLGILFDSYLSFSGQINTILGKLAGTSSILKTCKRFMPKKECLNAAQALITSDLYFSCEIYAFADKLLIDKIAKQVQKIGRYVLRKSRTQHISNAEVYKSIQVFPIHILIAIQTLSFWNKMYYKSNSHPLLQFAMSELFSSGRRQGFKERSLLIKPLQVLYDSFKLFCLECQLNGDNQNFHPTKIFMLNSEVTKGVFAPYLGRKFKKALV